MKYFFTFLFTCLIIFFMSSCSNPIAQSHEHNAQLQTTDVVRYKSSVHADWMIYDTFADLLEITDCVVVGKIVEQGDCFSIGDFTESDYSDFDTIVQNDSKKASYMCMSIRTPYTVEIQSVLYSNPSTPIPNTIQVLQSHGIIHGIQLDNPDYLELKPNHEYVLFLNYNQIYDTSYYTMVTPFQGWAEIVASDNNTSFSLFSNNNFMFHTDPTNQLFQEISSIEELKTAISHLTY